MNGMHGIIFSYEKQTQLRELIEHRVHGSIPFAGDYRVVDFALSSMVNAGVRDVGVIMHGKCQSMMDHLRAGKSWDLSRNHSGLTLLPAFAYRERGGGDGSFRGRVEALACVMDYLRGIRQEYVVLSDSDLVANLPLRDVLHAHIETGADVTAVCTPQPGDVHDTYFQLDETGRITDTATYLRAPAGYRCLNVFILRTELLLRIVEECAAHNQHSFRRGVLQEMRERLHLHAWVWEGYAARISTIQSYYQRSMELLDPAQRAALFCPERPVYAKENDAPPTYIDPTGQCVNSLIADGCDIQGSVRNCILFRGVRVEKDAVVENCILFKGTVVRRGAVLRHVIADKYVRVGEGVHLAGHADYPMVLAREAVLEDTARG